MTASFELSRKAVMEAAWATGFDEFTWDGHTFRWNYAITPRNRKSKWLLVCYPDGKLGFCRERWNNQQGVMVYNVLGVWQTEGDLRVPAPEAGPIPPESSKPNRASADRRSVIRVPTQEQRDRLYGLIQGLAKNRVWHGSFRALSGMTGLSPEVVRTRCLELQEQKKLMLTSRKKVGTIFVIL